MRLAAAAVEAKQDGCVPLSSSSILLMIFRSSSGAADAVSTSSAAWTVDTMEEVKWQGGNGDGDVDDGFHVIKCSQEWTRVYIYTHRSSHVKRSTALPGNASSTV